MSFIWRFWKDNGDGSFSQINDTLVLIKGGREIQWQVPSSEVGTYWIELVVDDDPYPDREIPGEKKECEKCSVISKADDPPVRDWVKVKVFAEDNNANLDCDSDNDVLLEENDEEEKKEDINPGCFVSLEEEERLVAKIKARSSGHKVRLFWRGQGQVTVYDEENNQPLQSPVEWSVPTGSSRRNFKVKGEGGGMIWFELIHLDDQDKIIATDKVVFTVPWEIVLVKEQGSNFTFTKMLPEVYISSPHPTIHLQQSQITIETLPDGSNIVALWLQGIIRSRTCDITPKGVINSFALYTNDDPSEPIIVSGLSDWDSNGIADVQVLKSFEGSLTRPYPFEAHFNVKVPIGGFDEGIHNLRLEVKDPVTGSIGIMEMEYEISSNESENKWEVTELSFIVVDGWEEFYPLAIRIGTSNAKFSENFLITLLNGVKRRVLKGPDNHWYVANEQGNRIDILFLTYDDNETLPLPPPVMLSDDKSTEKAMLPIYGLSPDSSNPYLQAAEFVLGIIVGFAEGGWNLVSGTAQGLWTVAKVIYAHHLEYTLQGKIEKHILKIVAPDFVQELEGITIKWDTLKAVAKVIQNMLKDTRIYHAVANGEWNKVPYALSHDFREALRLAAHLLKVAWEYVRDYVWSKWKGFLDANAYEKGKVIGKLVFEIVTIVIPFTKLGKIGQLSGGLVKIEFINRFLSRISRSRLAEHPKLVENLVNEGNALLRCLLSMCFAEGTLVWTRDGLKPVEQIKVGDWVLSKDPRLGKQEYRKVTATIKSNAMQLCKLRYRILTPQKTPIKGKLRQPAKTIAHENSKDGEESEEDDSESEEDEIECTKEHLFWVVNRQGFVPAGSLNVGDRLLLASGQEAVIVAISQKVVKSGQSFIIYNLEVEDFHTYFVGKKRVLVHNGCYKDYCELINEIRNIFKSAGWELSKNKNVGIAEIYKWKGEQKEQIGRTLVGVSGTKNIREETVINKRKSIIKIKC